MIVTAIIRAEADAIDMQCIASLSFAVTSSFVSGKANTGKMLAKSG